jgi:hypothetical protein
MLIKFRIEVFSVVSQEILHLNILVHLEFLGIVYYFSD